MITDRVETLRSDFFCNLLAASTALRWEEAEDGSLVGRDRTMGKPRWTATRVDLIFGSNSQLRALAEAHASDEAERPFIGAFVAASAKVIELDRFDLHR